MSIPSSTETKDTFLYKIRMAPLRALTGSVVTRAGVGRDAQAPFPPSQVPSGATRAAHVAVCRARTIEIATDAGGAAVRAACDREWSDAK